MMKKAFTLAEMMIVLLILSIILAAFAPIMTKRSTAGKSSEYWHSKNTGAQIYYGTAQNNRVNIGQENDSADDAAAPRLVINTGAEDQNHILFKRSGTNLLGFLKLDAKDSLRIGGTPLTEVDAYAPGIHNTGVGIGSLQSLSTGRENTAVGTYSLYSNTKGYDNTTVGSVSLYSNTEGGDNTAVGIYSMYTNTKGGQNTAVGVTSMFENITGYYNTAVGSASLYSNSTGNNNTALGHYACSYVTGSNNTCIGYNSGPGYNSPRASDDNQMWLGTDATTVNIPGNLTVTGTTTGPSETWTKSDIRLKNVKGENKSGLEKIKQLKVFNYTFKDDKKKTPRVGVIAQDLQKIFPDAVTKDEKGYLLIRMEDMFYALVNAVKELDAKVDSALSQGKILKQVQNDMAAKDAKIKELEARIQKLEAKLK